MKSKQCNTCSYHYYDNFCMLNLYYVSDDYTCGRWTDEEIKFDYDRVYRLCKSYIEVCDRYTDGERLKEKYPKEMKWEDFSNYDFFLNCCLNDLHRGEFMEDKKIRKLHIVHNCGECIFHEKIEISKTHLGTFYLDYCHRTSLYSDDSTKLFKYCNLPDYER